MGRLIRRRRLTSVIGALGGPFCLGRSGTLTHRGEVRLNEVLLGTTGGLIVPVLEPGLRNVGERLDERGCDFVQPAVRMIRGAADPALVLLPKLPPTVGMGSTLRT
jgi:hypothetical protein